MKKLTSAFLALPVLFLLSYPALAASPKSDDKTPAPVELQGAATETTIPEDAVPAAQPAPKGKKHAIAGDNDYVIGAGDVLQITVWKENDMDREVVVLPDGTISFPLIGTFTVAGMTPGQVQSTVKAKLASLIPGASVTVLVKAALGNSVSVIGQVQKPGEFVMGHRMSVMQALAQAGGLTPYASESGISILRHVDGKETSIPFDYSDIIAGHNLDKDIILNPGDVVVVPTAGIF